MKVADLHIRADAKLTAAAAAKKLKEHGKTKATIRTPELARRIAEEPADINSYSVEPGLLDPRAVIAELDRVIPKDWDSVSGSGHQSYVPWVMRGRRPEKYFAVREFGAIGNGISYAMGVAAANKDGKTVLFEGDGSLLMHIQELEVMQRHGIKLLMCIMNDGAYGAEIHKLRHDGIDDSGAIFGRTDLAAIAKGFGLRSANITELSQIKPLFDAYQAQDKAEIWNFQVSDRVVNPTMNRQVRRGHGKM
jgi:acetolactate synthase I/II/III large subunit